jgi:multiple sugar transport system permease protein
MGGISTMPEVAVRRDKFRKMIALLLKGDSLFAYLCLVPSSLLMLAIIFIPVVNVFTMAFSKTDQVGTPIEFVGLDNFVRLFNDPIFPQIVRQTLIWTVVMLVIATPISIALALVLNRVFRGRIFARAIIFSPWAVSFVFISVLWKYIFDTYYGHLNPLLSLLTGRAVQIAWLGKPEIALASVIWVGITLTIPFTTILVLAGVQSISPELIEAAKIDGASASQTFWKIKLPLLRSVITVGTIVNTIYIFNSFPIIWAMTEGGPVNYTDTLVTYLYKVTFRNLDFGKGAAISLVGFLFLMVFSILYVRSTSEEVF